MGDAKPVVLILAGPNGAGKSTAAESFVYRAQGIVDYVNADTIARGLSAFDSENAALPAGRVMLQHLAWLASARRSFGFETTLASRSFAPWIRGLRESGYQFRLFFLTLPSPAQAVYRVKTRVARGAIMCLTK